MRTDAESSRYAARLGVVITAVTTLALLSGAGLLAGCGGDGHEPAGAAVPARPDAASAGNPPVGNPPVGGSSVGGSSVGNPSAGGSSATAAGPAGGSDDAPAAAARTVEAYFREINDAARGGRLAVTTPTALAGCQPCALDVGVTRSLQQRGLHADAAAYRLTDLSARPRAGLVAAVTFTLHTSAVGLLDLAGRHVADAPGVPTRAATAELALTQHGWRIQTLRYAPGPA
ncbi:hypothetical protein FF36_05023 [Frankia torreyi]|uniref:Uncharacterized protein n=1 Tax=Frankia torreyi TaxID=1856 RepID=A0A0D8B8P9_9ACTN|nr:MULTISPECIES: hypothetical protein [Frankia]KJE20668.1 hypothetical protein FF36_05023 [Frankia torreyi]KQM03550.1 hypothetical protein FF86_103816 [Frankia sp. CpI1-P]